MSASNLKTQITQPVKNSLVFMIKVLSKMKNKFFGGDAKNLNWQLYYDAWSISKAELERIEEDLHRYSKEREYPPEYEAEFVAQRFRVHLSLKWIEQAMAERLVNKAPSSLQGLEMGGVTVVTDLLMSTFPQFNWQNTEGDIRYKWQNPDESADLIVSMEVLEHLSDIPDGINNGFYATGVKASLLESYRVLKPGGILFITTPNAASSLNLMKALAGFPTYFYQPHVREFTLSELKSFLQETGFTILRAQAVQCLTVDYKIDYTSLFQTLLDSLVDANLKDRGDDLFIVAVK